MTSSFHVVQPQSQPGTRTRLGPRVVHPGVDCRDQFTEPVALSSVQPETVRSALSFGDPYAIRAGKA